MRSCVRILLTSAFLFFCHSRTAWSQTSEENCIVKVKYEWSVPVGSCMISNNSYKAYFVNQCQQTLDIKLAIQEKSMRWKTFNHLSIAPGDTVVGFACEGTGKYVTWHRPTGNKTIIFPSDDQINRDYK